jgi:uncharacterized membrane protein
MSKVLAGYYSSVGWPRRGAAGRRFGLASLLGVAAGVATFPLRWQARELIGWDVACLCFLVATWAVVGPKSASETRSHALSEDPSVPLSELVVCSAGLACILGAGFAVASASRASGGVKIGLIALSVVSVLVSWAGVHTVFALRYARLFYGTGTKGGRGAGIDFNEDAPPDYRDFAYLAMTIGMTFQVSDTDLQSKTIRRTALQHALISWLFGVVIIGLTINVVASLLSGGG